MAREPDARGHLVGQCAQRPGRRPRRPVDPSHGLAIRRRSTLPPGLELTSLAFKIADQPGLESLAEHRGHRSHEGRARAGRSGSAGPSSRPSRPPTSGRSRRRSASARRGRRWRPPTTTAPRGGHRAREEGPRGRPRRATTSGPRRSRSSTGSTTRPGSSPNRPMRRRLIKDVSEHKAATVAELLGFMRYHYLMFSDPGRSPEAARVYEELYQLLRQQKDKLGQGGIAVATTGAGPDNVRVASKLGEVKITLEKVRFPQDAQKKRGLKRDAVLQLENAMDDLAKGDDPARDARKSPQGSSGPQGRQCPESGPFPVARRGPRVAGGRLCRPPPHAPRPRDPRPGAGHDQESPGTRCGPKEGGLRKPTSSSRLGLAGEDAGRRMTGGRKGPLHKVVEPCPSKES